MHDKEERGATDAKYITRIKLVSLYGGGQKTQQKAGDQAEIEQQERK